MIGFSPEAMLIEGVMTTTSESGVVNVAPMGPIVDASRGWFLFRPFKTSTTYKNLKATGVGVFHVIDDVLLIARAAIGRVEAVPAGREEAERSAGRMTRVDARTHRVSGRAAEKVSGLVLPHAVSWHELKVTSLDDSSERTRIEAECVHVGRGREWSGFNRARHAVIEAAILATRLHLTGRGVVLAELDRLRIAVDKTGSEAEHQAMEEVRAFVGAWQEPEAKA